MKKKQLISKRKGIIKKHSSLSLGRIKTTISAKKLIVHKKKLIPKYLWVLAIVKQIVKEFFLEK